MVLKSPRKLESDLAQERTARNVDRQVIEEDAVLNPRRYDAL